MCRYVWEMKQQGNVGGNSNCLPSIAFCVNKLKTKTHALRVPVVDSHNLQQLLELKKKPSQPPRPVVFQSLTNKTVEENETVLHSGEMD